MADALTKYEDQQQKLRDEHGYVEEDERGDEDFDYNTSIPEVNPEVYKDVEPLLFRGFLTLPASINGVPFVFKSLNHHEYNRVSLYQNSGNSYEQTQRYYNTFLSYGVLLVGGKNILPEREDALGDLVSFFEGLNKEVKATVIRYISDINRRATRATILTEAYFIEPASRLRWAQAQGLDLSSPAITGFGGTQNLGLNWSQLTWRALNHFEDLKDQSERDWENTKFIASATAGKGMNKVYSQDKRRRQAEKEAKIERREKLIRHVLLNEPLEGPIQGPIQVARTVEELNTQLERDLKGEQDWHDKVISAHENRAQQGYLDRMDYVRKLREKHIEEYGDRAVISSTEIKGLTPGDVQRRIQERQKSIVEGLARQAEFPELMDEKHAEFTEKWMNQKPTVQSPPSVMPAQVPTRPQGKPFNGGNL
jgi:hypothetical protein